MPRTKSYKDPLPVTKGLTKAIADCRQALSENNWQAAIEIAEQTRTEAFADHPRVQCVMRYYQVYALFRQQNYYVSEGLVQLVREALRWSTVLPSPEVQEVSPPYLFYIKKCFLFSILGHFAYQQQAYPLALLLLIPAYGMMTDSLYPMAGLEPKAPREEPLFCGESLTFSRMAHLYHLFGFSSDAFELLFYAAPEQFGAPFDASIVDEIRRSSAYEAYRQTAERYIPMTQDPVFQGQGAWHRQAAEVAQSLSYTWRTPLEVFADRSIPFAYAANQQNKRCVLVLQGDVHWQGDLILSEIGQFFCPPTNDPLSMVIIEGSLTVAGNVLLVSPSSAQPLQLLVEGNLQARVVFQQGLLAVSGYLKSEMLLLETHSVTDARQIETHICRRERDASIHGKLIEYWRPKNNKPLGPFAPLTLRGFLLSQPVLENGGVFSEALVQEQLEELLQLKQAFSVKRGVIEHLCPHSLNGAIEDGNVCYERLWHAYQQGLPLLA